MAQDALVDLTEATRRQLTEVRGRLAVLDGELAALRADERALETAAQALTARLTPKPAEPRPRPPARRAAAGGNARSRSSTRRSVSGPRRPGRMLARDEMLRLLREGPQTKQDLASKMDVSARRARELLDELRQQGIRVIEGQAADNPRAKAYTAS